MRTRIPTIIGLLLVVGIVAALAYMTERVFRTPSQASLSTSPEQVLVTNISDSSFTVTWVTQEASTGTVEVESGRIPAGIYFDERDSTGKLGKYRTHSVHVRDAKADTTYRFSVLSNGKKFLNGESPYSVQTPMSLPLNTNGLEPAYGAVRTTNGLPASDVLVILTVEGGQTLSSLTKQSGSWLIPLNQVRTQDLTSYLPVIERMNESLIIRDGSESAVAVSDTLNDSPIPDMQLGKEYDFRKQQAKAKTAQLAMQTTPAAPPVTPAATGFPNNPAVLGDTVTVPAVVSITSPKNGSSVPSTKPLFSGTAVPGKFVGLSIGSSNPIHASVKTNANGLWSYTPTKPLGIGKQSVTVSTVNAKNAYTVLTNAFTVLKSGTQVLGDATPSATLVPTDTEIPTETPTDTVEITDTLTPTDDLTGQEPPETGYELPVILLAALGLVLLGGGFAVLRQ